MIEESVCVRALLPVNRLRDPETDRYPPARRHGAEGDPGLRFQIRVRGMEGSGHTCGEDAGCGSLVLSAEKQTVTLNHDEVSHLDAAVTWR